MQGFAALAVWALATCALLGLAGCGVLGGHGGKRSWRGAVGPAVAEVGAAAGSDAKSDKRDDEDEEDPLREVPHTALLSRRLTVAEIDATLALVLGDESKPAFRLLGDDPRAPFDNRSDLLDESLNANRIEALETMAGDVAARLVADGPRLTRVLGCNPGNTAAQQEACLRTLVEHAGRSLFRRSLAADEIDRITAGAAAAAAEDGEFNAGVAFALAVLLQHPDFVYRLERGEPADGGLRKLTDREWLTRVSFVLTGAAPETSWLDTAEQGGFADAPARKAMLETIWASPRTLAQMDRMHAMWLSYENLPYAGNLGAAMRQESLKLLEATSFTKNGSWLDMLTSPRTYVDKALATHYGLPAPAGAAGWIEYGNSGRGGLLSQGSVLSLGARPSGDTSPTIRGKLVRERLFCQKVPPPPPNANIDSEPKSSDGSPCKKARYQSHAANGACAGCHKQMDPIGFGLEAYDGAGRFRSAESELPECAIDGQGEVAGVAKFSGPGELGRLLVEKDIVGGCFAKQVWQYMEGRNVAADAATYTLAMDGFKKADYRLKSFMIDMLASDAVVLAAPLEGLP
jgi:hypothetical protein